MNNLVQSKDFFSKPQVMAKFQELLGAKATGFVSSVLQVVNSNGYLQKADPKTVYTAAMMAASLDLPINQNLGFAYIVPYGDKAQFQMGYKGFIQLAQRTGQYRAINAITVDEGHFVSWNPLTEELELDFSKKPTGKVVGYAAYIELINGFKKCLYWTKDEVTKHASRYSQSFKHKSSPWNTNFDEMAVKTVLKMVLSKYAPLTIEMQRATIADQAVINSYDNETEEIEVEYVDNEPEQIEPTKEVLTDIEGTVRSIELGMTTLEQLEQAYELTDEQRATLSTVKPKK